MRVFKGFLAAVLLAGSFAANAVPTVWVDYIDFNPDRLITGGHHFDYTHNINDNGYTPFVDVVLGYELSVNLYDDGDRALEVALIDVPGLIGDRAFFNLSGGE